MLGAKNEEGRSWKKLEKAAINSRRLARLVLGGYKDVDSRCVLGLFLGAKKEQSPYLLV